MNKRDGLPSVTVPDLLTKSWERRDATDDVRLQEAERCAVERVSQIVTFVRWLTQHSPHMQSMLAIMAGKDYDKELLHANAVRIVGSEPEALEALIQLESTFAQTMNVHEDLRTLRAMIDELKAK